MPEAGRVLVVDDDESLLEVLRLHLSKAGFHAATAEDGLKGLEKAKVFRPHVIVLDLMMPRLNGFELIHRLQTEDLSSVPVIVITGFSDSANEQLIRQEPNVVDFVKKPFDHTELIARIRGVIPQ